ncbi:hypothetical protein AcW1_006547 [Taiwanofungus camphoratus]|nr:hypothetical protein AcW1_006547 [Antrodia cinnamomea]
MSIAQLQSSTVTTVKAAPAYPFLSQPPPQKKRPTQPLPSPPLKASAPTSPRVPVNGRRRSATTSAITAWISNVQPGSPAPLTPRRRPSLSSARRPSISPRSGRRPSVSSARVPSTSFLNLFDTPTTASRITPSAKDFKPDLTSVGYTSVFVHFPTTPSSALPAFTDRRPSIVALPLPPVPQTSEKPKRGLKHFRSLSALKPTRSRSKSTTMPSSPPATITKGSVPPPPSAHTRAETSASVSKNKKSKYAKYRPPPLAAELALAQLVDGGKMDDHIRQFAEAQARAAGATMVDGKLVGVGDVWRDGAGGVWRDQDEEWEYAHLLGGDEDFCTPEGEWVEFSSAKGQGSVEDEERRGSVSSQDSDLDPRYAMQAEAEERDDLAVFGSALLPPALRKPGMSVLALPSRNRRAAPHLRKPEFLLDVFPVPQSPPHHQTKAPLSALDNAAPQTRSTGKERRRPVPLTLTPPSPAHKCPTNPMDADQVRKDFIENSFAPAPAPIPSRPAAPSSRVPVRTDSRTITARKVALKSGTLKMDVRGLLRAMGGKKVEI